MKLAQSMVSLLLALSLFGCGKPVPVEKAAYVGEWQDKTMYLLITQDGSVRYKRLNAGVTTSINGPLSKFDGDNLEVGIWPMSKIFVDSKHP